MIRVTGTLVWYFYICKRQVWLMAHELIPYQQDEFLVLGRFLSEETYKREKKEIKVGDVSVDLIKREGEYLLTGEIKKSSRSLKASTMQLAYYLKILKHKGIEARGVLLVPQEKKRFEVKLDSETLKELDFVEKEIVNIMRAPFPPPVEKIKFCRNCAYKELCFS